VVCINVLLNESNCKLIELENYLEKKRHPKIYKSPLMYLYLCETVIIKKYVQIDSKTVIPGRSRQKIYD